MHSVYRSLWERKQAPAEATHDNGLMRGTVRGVLWVRMVQHIYVASCALANLTQTMRAFVDGERYQGTSLIICYAPCIEHGIRPAGLDDMFTESRAAIDTGYWPLFRFNPERKVP